MSAAFLEKGRTLAASGKHGDAALHFMAAADSFKSAGSHAAAETATGLAKDSAKAHFAQQAASAKDRDKSAKQFAKYQEKTAARADKLKAFANANSTKGGDERNRDDQGRFA